MKILTGTRTNHKLSQQRVLKAPFSAIITESTQHKHMSYYWTTKLNTATNRRIEKLESEGVKVDTSTHTGRQVIGYNYLELAFDESYETL